MRLRSGTILAARDDNPRPSRRRKVDIIASLLRTFPITREQLTADISQLPLKEKVIRKGINRKSKTEELRAKRLKAYRRLRKAARNQRSPFISLPPEIRNMIYGYVVGNQVFKLDYKCKGTRALNIARISPLKFELSLLFTCRFIEKELDGFIFKKNSFRFHHHVAVYKFINLVPDSNLARIETLNLDITLFSKRNMEKWLRLMNTAVLEKFTGLKYVEVRARAYPRARIDEWMDEMERLEEVGKERNMDWKIVS